MLDAKQNYYRRQARLAFARVQKAIDKSFGVAHWSKLLPAAPVNKNWQPEHWATIARDAAIVSAHYAFKAHPELRETTNA